MGKVSCHLFHCDLWIEVNPEFHPESTQRISCLNSRWSPTESSECLTASTFCTALVLFLHRHPAARSRPVFRLPASSRNALRSNSTKSCPAKRARRVPIGFAGYSTRSVGRFANTKRSLRSTHATCTHTSLWCHREWPPPVCGKYSPKGAMLSTKPIVLRQSDSTH